MRPKISGIWGRIGTSRPSLCPGTEVVGHTTPSSGLICPRTSGAGIPSRISPAICPRTSAERSRSSFLRFPPLPAGHHPLIWPAGKPSADLDPRSRHTRQAYRKRKRGNVLDRRESRRARCAGRNRCRPTESSHPTRSCAAMCRRTRTEAGLDLRRHSEDRGASRVTVIVL